VAARLQLADGRRAFVKAVGPEPNPESAEMHRREARVAAALPSAAPASRLLHHHDDGRWVALVFEDVDGRQPVLPWKAAELALVLEAVEQLAETLSPSPIELEPISMVHAGDYAGFDEIRGRLAAGEPLEPLDPWAAENIDLLCRLEAGWVDASRGDTLLQLDLRADNLLIAGGQVVIVDWPHAALVRRGST
jgi:hypothetical protein